MWKFALLFLLACSFSFQTLSEKKDQVALLVGISNYPADSGWPAINGENDLILITEALIARGFEPENIHLLRGPEATKDQILNTLRHLSKQIAKDGFFVFHFSGHGQQVTDKPPQLDEVDGYDEALVPYDALSSTQGNTYQGEKHLLDDELRKALYPIRRKLGKNGQLLLLLDACHSGSGARAFHNQFAEPSRGAPQPLNLNPSPPSIADTGFISNFENKKRLAPCILITATRAAERNQECRVDDQYFGPLSYAFARTFPELDPDASYQHLFEKIQWEIAAVTDYQVPTFEGAPDLKVGQNHLSPTHAYLLPFNSTPADLEINAGKLKRVFAGTRLAFYPSATDTTNRKITTGTVIHAKLFTSVVALDSLPHGQPGTIKRAYITHQNLGNIQVSLALDIDDPDLEAALLDQCADIEAIRLVRRSPDLIISQSGTKIQVIADQHLIHSTPWYPQNVSQIAGKLIENTVLRYAQSQFLAALDIQNPDIQLKMRFLPVEVVEDHNQTIVESWPIPAARIQSNASGYPIIPIGMHYQIEVSNHGSRPAYFSIVDFQPNGDFSVILPFQVPINGGLPQAQDYYLLPGQTTLLPGHYWEMGPPTGLEQFSLIATDTPLDLQAIDQSNGKKGLNGNSFAQLFRKTWNLAHPENANRKGNLPPIYPSEVHIEKTFVEITGQNLN